MTKTLIEEFQKHPRFDFKKATTSGFPRFEVKHKVVHGVECDYGGRYWGQVDKKGSAQGWGRHQHGTSIIEGYSDISLKGYGRVIQEQISDSFGPKTVKEGMWHNGSLIAEVTRKPKLDDSLL